MALYQAHGICLIFTIFHNFDLFVDPLSSETYSFYIGVLTNAATYQMTADGDVLLFHPALQIHYLGVYDAFVSWDLVLTTHQLQNCLTLTRGALFLQ